jgi:hypothetical protein
MRTLVLGAAIIAASGALCAANAQSTPAPIVQPPQMQQRVIANGGAAANNNNNYQAQALPGPVANPAPGTMVMHMNGAVWSEFGIGPGAAHH